MGKGIHSSREKKKGSFINYRWLLILIVGGKELQFRLF